MVDCPYCGKELKDSERYCWNCENDVSKIVDKSQSPKCFIASSVYGEASKEVQFLRDFRDKKMEKLFWGKIFIIFYYKTSPKIAKFVSKNKFFLNVAKINLDFIIFLIKKIS